MSEKTGRAISGPDGLPPPPLSVGALPEHAHQSKQTDLAAEGAEQMLDVRLPHVHAPHEEKLSWRGFLAHIAVVVIGLLIALGLEQGVEYLHHDIQRERLEADMRATFSSNMQQAEKDVRTLNDLRTYLILLRNAVSSHIAGGSARPPAASDPRNSTFVPPPSLGAYEAAKVNGSVSLLSIDRIRLFDRIEFQHTLMQQNFWHFYDAVRALGAFANRFDNSDTPSRSRLPQPDISKLSPAELVEYRALIATAIQYSQFYGGQLSNLVLSYGLVLTGAKDANTLIDATDKAQRSR